MISIPKRAVSFHPNAYLSCGTDVVIKVKVTVIFRSRLLWNDPVADPGFPVGGGADPLVGGTNLQCIHFSAKMYVKMKEMDPVGGGGGGGRAGGAPRIRQWNQMVMCFDFYPEAGGQLSSECSSYLC